MSARLRIASLAALAVALAASPFWGPPLMRRLPGFRVQRVEISGTRLLAPHQVLAASGLRPGQNLWDDVAAMESALRASPAIADARVTRKLPGTLRIRVEEKRPVAYVEAGTLQPVTAAGEILPIDPTRAPVDLPVIRGAWSRLPARSRAALLGETERLTRLDPALLGEVSEIRADAAVGTLTLTHRLGVIVVPVGVASDRLAQLHAVLLDLEGRLPPPDASSPTARIDLRFGEQVIVRLPSSV